MYTPYGHVSAPLSTIAVNYVPEGGIARIACPWVKVPQETGKYPIFGMEEVHPRSDVLGDKTTAQELDWYTGWGYFQTTARALRCFIPGRLLAGADSVIKVQASTVRKLRHALDLMREKRLAALFDATVGTTGMDSGDQSDAWATASTGLPLATIADAKRAFKVKTGVKATHIVIPDDVKTAMVKTAEWKAEVQPTHSDRIETWDDLPSKILGLKPIVAEMQGAAELITTSVGTPATLPTMTDIWGDHVYLMRINPRPSITDPSACYELGFIPETARTYQAPELGIRGGQWIQVEFMSAQKMIASYYLYRIQNVI